MPHETIDMPAELASLFEGDVFDRVMSLQGRIYRDVPGRKTIQVELGGQSCFVKQHFGVGWREVLKNLLSLRLPVFSARTERDAIRRLGELGIPTTPALAYGERGWNPVTRQSFLITQDLGDIVSLEDFCRDWPVNPPPLQLKRRLMLEVARIARTLHGHGMNHRDFYLCHFCLDRPALAQGRVVLYLIDLHRVGLRDEIRPRDRMKDLAALYFSVMDIGLSRRDYLRFLAAYRAAPRQPFSASEVDFWHEVGLRADRLYLKYQQRGPR